jgi:hypothetical protein
MLVSPNLPPREQAIYGVLERALTKQPPPDTAIYLDYHRTKHRTKLFLANEPDTANSGSPAK